MTYTSAEVITIIVAVGGLVTVIGGVVVQIMTARVKRAVKDEVAQVLVPVVTETLTTAKVIAGHVNSEKSIAEGEIKTLNVEVRILREQLAVERQNAAILAARAPVPIQIVNGPVPKSLDAPRPSSEESLNRIDVNTKETARNTERTEAVVQDLKNQS